MLAQGKSHDGIPAGVIEKVWHSSLQGIDARGFDPKTQLEGGWNPTFSIFVRPICSSVYISIVLLRHVYRRWQTRSTPLRYRTPPNTLS